ncbi:MAG: DUF1801 domain-containing protein [Micromonosporaceae bacterium]
MSVLDDYFSRLDPPAREAFARIRTLALEVAPGAEEGTSYGMAALIYKRKPLLGFRAARRHLSIFPFSSDAVDAVRDRLAGFDLSKGTVRFTAAKPLPAEAVRDLVRHRLGEIEATAR